jgi:hypothetical protein
VRYVIPLLIAAFLAGCDGPGLFAFGAVNAVSLSVAGRTVPDIAVSAISGRDCSLARYDRGDSYCAPPAAQPGQQPYCTRSLGSVDCWTRPPEAPGRAGVADPPRSPEATRPWHNLW